MSETLFGNTNEYTPSEKESSSQEHGRYSSHHCHHHHRSSSEKRHHSSRHRSSHHSSAHERTSSSKSSSHTKRFSIVDVFKNTKVRDKKVSEYRKLSQRVLFVTVFTIIVSYSVYFFANDKEDSTLSNAVYTPSENSQLKRQVTMLRQEIDDLTAELNRYIEKYGELEEEEESVQITEE